MCEGSITREAGRGKDNCDKSRPDPVFETLPADIVPTSKGLAMAVGEMKRHDLGVRGYDTVQL